MPRELKVVDISAENNQETLDNDEVTEIPNEEKSIENEPAETVNEIIQESPLDINEEEVKAPVLQRCASQVKLTPNAIIAPPNTPNAKTKTSHLIQCPRCSRWMTEKTLKFAHEKTCKAKAEVYIPKTLQNKKKKANEIVGTVKQAIERIEQEKEVKRPKDIFKPVRQASQPPVHSLEPIQERVPLYSDLRRERIEQHKNKMTHVFEKAFN